MRLLPVMIALLAATTAAPSAFAQSTSGSNSGGSGSSGGGGGGGFGGQPSVGGRSPSSFPDSMSQFYFLQSEMFRQNLTRLAQNAEQRVLGHRAIRVGDVVRKGDCTGAEALARKEGDAQMAERVVAFCEPGKGWSRQARQALRRSRG